MESLQIGHDAMELLYVPGSTMYQALTFTIYGDPFRSILRDTLCLPSELKDSIT